MLVGLVGHERLVGLVGHVGPVGPVGHVGHVGLGLGCWMELEGFLCTLSFFLCFFNYCLPSIHMPDFPT